MHARDAGMSMAVRSDLQNEPVIVRLMPNVSIPNRAIYDVIIGARNWDKASDASMSFPGRKLIYVGVAGRDWFQSLLDCRQRIEVNIESVQKGRRLAMVPHFEAEKALASDVLTVTASPQIGSVDFAIMAELFSARPLRAADDFTGGHPQKDGRERQNNGENGDDRFAISMKDLSFAVKKDLHLVDEGPRRV